MPLIPATGRQRLRVRARLGVIYGVLAVGAAAMLYPFLFMLSGSFKSAVDVHDHALIPRYWRDDSALYRTYVEALFNESIELFRTVYDEDVRSFAAATPPSSTAHAWVDEWLRFVQERELPDHSYILGFVEARFSRTTPALLRAFREHLHRQFGSIVEVNRRLGTEFADWNAVHVVAENPALRVRPWPRDPFYTEFRRFKRAQPPLYRVYIPLTRVYQRQFLRPRFRDRLEEYNRKYQRAFSSWSEIPLPERCPEGPESECWELFVRQVAHVLWIRIERTATDAYQRYLRAKYGTIENLNRAHGAVWPAFDEVALPAEPPESGLPLADWEMFLKGWTDPSTGELHEAPLKSLRLEAPEFAFRAYLRERYGSIEALNEAVGTAFKHFDEILPPQREAHHRLFLQNRRSLRWEFATRNYRFVADHVLLHGRGLWNTAIYCLLAVLTALAVNPLAAYALSRHRPQGSYGILLFLLLTMAFPPIVTQIPLFIMLRNWNLLNSFAALVLPGMAHGYSIYLLKGFFDSLPRDLYESAELDGAGEWALFWHITLALSRPVLAVIALGAFTTAYTNFMFALLLCQDERMWTLMVWLYQLQTRSGPAAIYASLVIAALPTLIVFLAAQKIILRGIVLPVER